MSLRLPSTPSHELSTALSSRDNYCISFLYLNVCSVKDLSELTYLEVEDNVDKITQISHFGPTCFTESSAPKLEPKEVHKRRERIGDNGENNAEMVTKGVRGEYIHRREWIFEGKSLQGWTVQTLHTVQRRLGNVYIRDPSGKKSCLQAVGMRTNRFVLGGGIQKLE